MVHQTAHSARRSGRPQWSGRQGGRRQKRRQEQTRLLQLLVCLAIFLLVFIGKGVFPNRLVQVRDNLLSLITADVDFQAAFSGLGDSMSQGETILDELGQFCVEVFGGSREDPEQPGASGVPELASMVVQEQQFLSAEPDGQALASHFFYEEGLPAPELPQQPVQAQPAQEPVQEEPAVAAVGTVIRKSDYDGQALPASYTMDELSLGTLETMTPVLGHISSGFGYRDHPINGNYQFHGGVDIGANMGDPIQAFASGTVEYTGEDDSYGLYFQIDHGNGVKSFYAHCSTVLVRKGQAVSIGDTVALVGSTGTATGPHLHLELRCAGLRVNPIYYIEYLSDQ